VTKQANRSQEIFLSHASKNHRFATKLARLLTAHGLRVWYSKTHIVGARQWHDEIGSALSRCGWFVVLLSKHSVKSIWVKRELLYALQQKRYLERIVPVLVERCDVSKLSWTLPSFQIVDLTREPLQGYRELLRVWRLRYNPKTHI